MDSRINFH